MLHRIKFVDSVQNPGTKIIKLILPGKKIRYIKPESIGISQAEIMLDYKGSLNIAEQILLRKEKNKGRKVI